MKASKFFKLKTRLEEASKIVIEAVKEISVVVEKAVEEENYEVNKDLLWLKVLNAFFVSFLFQ
jgi:hypothetical protein